MRRRTFLAACLGTAATAICPTFAAPGTRQRTLVLLELTGGNDTLNTFVPYADPAYRAARPRIAIPRDKVIVIDEQLGLHPDLAPLLPAWRQRDVALLQGMGYPEPNRSHFRAMEIWDTGSDSDAYLDSGWLARTLSSTVPRPGAVADAIVLGDNPGPVGGRSMRTLVMEDTQRFLARAAEIGQASPAAASPALAHILGVKADIRSSAQKLDERLRDATVPVDGFPATRVGRRLAEAARLVLADAGVPVIKLAHGSFDTHANQPAVHARLLRELAEALAAFRDTLIERQRWDDVLVMTYSEFGRRVAENASRGTDHGAAATHLLMGGQVRGGLFGSRPSLQQLERGDLRYTTDFRALYNTVATNWFGRPPLYPLSHHPPLPVLAT